MTALDVLPCRLMRYSKGSQNLVFDSDIELDRITLANEIARTKAESSSVVAASTPLARDGSERAVQVAVPCLQPLRT